MHIVIQLYIRDLYQKIIYYRLLSIEFYDNIYFFYDLYFNINQ